jgi:hypothetical protein
MDAPALQIFSGDDCALAPLPVRGVGWVLRWAASLAVLAGAATILVVFAYQVAAERTLVRAANAGLREAALPRATHASVEAAIRRRLAGAMSLDRATHVIVSSAGNRASVHLAVPVAAVLPRWLPIVRWFDGAEILVQRDE